ncbi:hypothetical protein SAMN02745220_00320 [Desulfopila aestuarii DSM 18488]|uniref:Uncharacterized protein n=1 Tax=Desulfopila aestuarii DSM 18488 TaxID=1121416 RepID=A0A1M7XWM3_9BACT|nr:hypothetical protein SAMN02745220_00320 [Desulfopila aestuarii DSM 18488]
MISVEYEMLQQVKMSKAKNRSLLGVDIFFTLDSNRKMVHTLDRHSLPLPFIQELCDNVLEHRIF